MPMVRGVAMVASGLWPHTTVPGALHGLDDTVCPAAEAREFVGGLPGVHFIGLPGVTHSYHHPNRWWPALEAAWRQLTAPGAGAS